MTPIAYELVLIRARNWASVTCLHPRHSQGSCQRTWHWWAVRKACLHRASSRVCLQTIVHRITAAMPSGVRNRRIVCWSSWDYSMSQLVGNRHCSDGCRSDWFCWDGLSSLPVLLLCPLDLILCLKSRLPFEFCLPGSHSICNSSINDFLLVFRRIDAGAGSCALLWPLNWAPCCAFTMKCFPKADIHWHLAWYICGKVWKWRRVWGKGRNDTLLGNMRWEGIDEYEGFGHDRWTWVTHQGTKL